VCTTSIFMVPQELEKQGLLIGCADTSIKFPIRVILDLGGKITWDRNGLYMTISTAQFTWTLDLLRKYATDMEFASHAKEDPLNTALQLTSSPQTFILSTGTTASTGMQCDAEQAISSGGEPRIIFNAKKITLKKREEDVDY